MMKFLKTPFLLFRAGVILVLLLLVTFILFIVSYMHLFNATLALEVVSTTLDHYNKMISTAHTVKVLRKLKERIDAEIKKNEEPKEPPSNLDA